MASKISEVPTDYLEWCFQVVDPLNDDIANAIVDIENELEWRDENDAHFYEFCTAYNGPNAKLPVV